ncbi:unnamed protein product [Nippostrongylus brasiliensis]|uniref:SCP domain-containing protein n=1 Tax=Nippostrongylus brasiliensis TaxID=27835 RepID=A0A158R0C6_NIPBR|nr:unnamed protein product [Nippostrongylus brasiliensis]
MIWLKNVMLKWNSTEMACAYRTFDSGDSMRLICAYNVKAGVIGQPIFEAGNEACTDGAKCGDDGTCFNMLCRVRTLNPDVVLPIYSPQLTCFNSSLMSQFSRYYAVNVHNYYRRLIASGWAENKLTLFTPRAAGMAALIMHDKYKNVGCAVNNCASEGFTIVECRYGPNILQDGDTIYDTGVPCSKCDKSEKCVFGIFYLASTRTTIEAQSCPYLSLTSNRLRYELREYTNGVRRDAVSGEAYLPPGRLMNELAYNCEMEYNLKKIQEQLGNGSSVTYRNFGVNIGFGGLDQCALKRISDILIYWMAGEVNIPENLQYNGNSAIAPVAKMLKWNATEMACSYQIFDHGNTVQLICAFNVRRLIATGWAESKLTIHTPRAAGMSVLVFWVYDCALEGFAAESVAKCQRNIGAIKKDSTDTGRNVAFIEDTDISGEAAIAQAVGEWVSELQKFDLDPSSIWTVKSSAMNVTNIMHDKYKKVGCAVNTCPTEGITIVECRYGPT